MEVDNSLSARRTQPTNTPYNNGSGASSSNSSSASSASSANSANSADSANSANKQSTTVQRNDVVAAASASNTSRGDAGRAFLGVNNTRTQSEPAQPRAGGDVDAVYRDAGSPPSSSPSSSEAGFQARAPGITRSGAGRAARKTGEPGEAPAPEQPPTAGGAVAGSQNPRETLRKLAEQADVPVRGVPMSPGRVNTRAAQISRALMDRRTPPAFGGRPVEVTPAERRILDGNDQAARQRTADEIGRREAQRDSIVQAVGKDGLARIERAYEQMSEQQREAVAPQKNPQQVAANLEEIARGAAWLIGPSLLAGAMKALTSTRAGAAAKKAYDKLREMLDLPHLPGGRRPSRTKANKKDKASRTTGAKKAKAPRKPRTAEQKARRRELEEQRRLERARQRETQPPMTTTPTTTPPTTPTSPH